MTPYYGPEADNQSDIQSSSNMEESTKTLSSFFKAKNTSIGNPKSWFLETPDVMPPLETITNLNTKIVAELTIRSQLPFTSWSGIQEFCGEIIDLYEGCLFYKPIYFIIYNLLIHNLTPMGKDNTGFYKLTSVIDGRMTISTTFYNIRPGPKQFQWLRSLGPSNGRVHIDCTIKLQPTTRICRPLHTFITELPAPFTAPSLLELLEEYNITYTNSKEELIFKFTK